MYHTMAEASSRPPGRDRGRMLRSIGRPVRRGHQAIFSYDQLEHKTVGSIQSQRQEKVVNLGRVEAHPSRFDPKHDHVPRTTDRHC